MALTGTVTNRNKFKTFAAADRPDLYSNPGGLTEILTQIDAAVAPNVRSGFLSLVNSIAYSVIATLTIPANVMGANGIVRAKLIGDYYNASGGASALSFGFAWGVQIPWFDTFAVNMEPSAVRRPVVIEITINNRGVTNSQFAAGTIFVGDYNGAPANGIGKLNGPINDANTIGRVASFASNDVALTTDTTLAVPLAFKAMHGVAAANIELRCFAAIAEVL